MKAILTYLTGSFINLTVLIFIKQLGLNKSLQIEEVIFFRTIFSSLILIPLSFKDIKKFHLPNKKILILIITLCILSSVDPYLFNNALQMMPINNAMLLIFLSPIFSSFTSFLILKEKITKNIILNFIINFFCILMIYRFNFIELNIGYLLIFLDIIIYSFLTIIIKVLSNYYSVKMNLLFRILFLLPVSFFMLKKIPILNLKTLILALLISLGYLSERYLITKAYTLSDIVSLQPFRYFNIVFSIILSYLILNEETTMYQIFGATTIVISSLILNKEKLSK